MANKASQGRSKINQRLLDAPAGAVLTLAWLKARGISPKLTSYYATSGWLHRIGEGAFTLKPDSPDWLGAVFGLQQKTTLLHPGGRTALELASVAHFLPLGDQAPIHLFGRSGERLPEWFKHLPWAGRVQHVRTNFLPPELGLREHQAGGFAVRVSDPERAILEFLLHLTPNDAGYEHASLVFEGLGTLRPPLIQALLEKCTSVKVKRLFLHLAEKHEHPWFQQLNLAKVSLGSGKRVFVPNGRLDPKYLITVPAVSETPTDAP
ncbi:MAG TPA: type IV toxin-antitoxin system AbiEi family antitoxin domain-containing protein [Verrucomicrobiae bacterium]|nr:type IV toxin-antitoxin system AbiEi family antitoxin domain-containing protein [Verrucomicrobiae bacterium]